MTKHEKFIIRRTEVIDEVFHNWINSRGARALAISLRYHLWEERMLCNVSDHIIMIERLEIDFWDRTLNPTEEIKIIQSNLCTFIRNRHRDKMRDEHRLYNKFR